MNGARLTRNAMKFSPTVDPIIRFGGSPIRVAVPPMLDARVSAMMNGTGETFIWEATIKVTGTTRSTVVTLSRNAERIAVAITSRIMVRAG